MVPSMMAITSTVRNTAKEDSPGQMAARTTVTSRTITSRVVEPTTGLTEGCSSDPGSITKWKATVLSHGQMVGNTKVTTSTIRKKDMAFSTGPMAESMKETGK